MISLYAVYVLFFMFAIVVFMCCMLLSELKGTVLILIYSPWFHEFSRAMHNVFQKWRNRKMKADIFVTASPRWGSVSPMGWNFLGNLLFSWSSYCILIATQGCWLPAWTCFEMRESTSRPTDNPDEQIGFNEATSLIISNIVEGW